jgi:carbon-monoxide dehydrogenase large subunit
MVSPAHSERSSVVATERIVCQRAHPCPLETYGCVASMDKVNGDLHVSGAARRAHGRLADLRHPQAQDPHRLTRYWRRLWQQGRGLPGLHLLDRRLDCAWRAVKWVEDRMENSLFGVRSAASATVNGEVRQITPVGSAIDGAAP